MKIIFVCDTMGSGGAERVISTLSNGFVNRGHDVGIVMLSREATKPFYELDKNIHVKFLKEEYEKKLNFFKKARILKNYIFKNKPDIVISFLSYVCIYTWWALRHAKISYIVSERNDPNSRSKLKQLLLNKSFKKAAGCVFQTEDARDWYGRKIAKKSEIIYNPVNLTFVPPQINERKNQILYVGRLNEQKNLFMLIDSFKIFLENHQNHILKIYGDGPLKGSLLNYINQNNLSKKIILSPSSKTWQKDEYDSNMFVLPSKFEGMPNVLIEALCLGMPSVSTNCPIGGPKELKKVFPELLAISDNISSDSFASAMEQAIKIKNNVSFVPKSLEKETIIDRWLDYIEKSCR